MSSSVRCAALLLLLLKPEEGPTKQHSELTNTSETLPTVIISKQSIVTCAQRLARREITILAICKKCNKARSPDQR